MKRYRRHIFICDTIFVLLIAALVILYGHLIGFYMEHALFIVFVFILLITASIYVYDVIRQTLHQRIKGLHVTIRGVDYEKCLPKTITINEIRRKNHQLVYRYQGYNIPICFVEHVDHEKAHLYPFYEEKTIATNLYEVVENYRYEFFLIKDNHHNKYIINQAQVLSIE